MSIDTLERPDSRWVYTPPKLYGWLISLFLTAFGGLMCSVPVGAILGVPVVVAGLLLCLSFTVSMSATAVRQSVSLPLVLAGLALLVLGRWLAPVDQIIASFRAGRDLINNPGPGGAFGIPLMLMGTILVATVIPWVRAPERLTYARSVPSMVLIQVGAVLLLIGAVLTAPGTELADEPFWIWIAVPLAFGIGVGLRMRWRGVRWILAAVVTGSTLPLIWFLLG